MVELMWVGGVFVGGGGGERWGEKDELGLGGNGLSCVRTGPSTSSCCVGVVAGRVRVSSYRDVVL